MTKWCRLLAVLSAVLVMVAACKPQTPKQYIQPKKMEDILVDYHLARAMADLPEVRELTGGTHNVSETMLVDGVLKKHQVSQALFDSSLVYYYTRADRFYRLYENVAKRLEDQALTLGASEGELGKYANAKGDTANIWAGRSQMMLMPRPPYHRVDFELEGDSLFRYGDKVLLQFMADFMVQAGNKSGMIYMAFEMGDTTIARSQRFSANGLARLEYQVARNKKVKTLRGFVMFADDSQKAAASRLLFLNNIQLIRFHTQPADNTSPITVNQQHATTQPTTVHTPGGVPPTDAQQRSGAADAGSRDTSGNGRKVVSSDAGTALHGTLQRVHPPAKR